MSGDDRQEAATALTRRQRDTRNARVFADRARGLSWAAIEQRHGISERQSRRIVDGYIASRRPTLELYAAAVIRELLAQFEQAIEDLALLADDTSNEAVKLGAIARRLDVVERRSPSDACSGRDASVAPGGQLAPAPDGTRSSGGVGSSLALPATSA
jgi:hypothetical protein